MASTGENDDLTPIETSLTCGDLLANPLLNKGSAFEEQERLDLHLLGLLPPDFETLDEQVERAYEAYQVKDSDMERHIYLRQLQDTNETLFYSLVLDHLPDMMPIIYTPVVGEACQKFSEIYRRPRGLFLPYPERERMDTMLANVGGRNVEVIVVTDGERILGLGDQGAGGMGIPIGKLSLYTACGGIDPATTLPILLDVGTNNEERLKDPLYVGWRHERVTGDDYYDFVDTFVQGVKKRYPNILLQFEDFAQTHAEPLLERYRDQLCTFNDDIQGTAAVTVGTLFAAANATGKPLSEHKVAFLGAGSAGCGIAEQIVAAMVAEGVSEKDARARMYMVDRPGLLLASTKDLMPFQEALVQDDGAVAQWTLGNPGRIELLDVIKNARPTILVGVSGQPGLFTEDIIREMGRHAERPIVFPLSNPTSRVEAVPEDIMKWTEGRALIATGSPFAPVTVGKEKRPIAQCNNSYIFPGMGLGILAIGARRVSDGMFMAASKALAETAPASKDPNGALLPPLTEVREVGQAIGAAVAGQALSEGLCDTVSPDEIPQRIAAKFWEPKYRPIRRKP